MVDIAYRLTLACEYEGTLQLRTRVRVHRVYRSIPRTRIYPALKQLGQANSHRLECSSGRSCQRDPGLRKTINRPSRDTAICQHTNRGARIWPSNSGTRDLPKVITIL